MKGKAPIGISEKKDFGDAVGKAVATNSDAAKELTIKKAIKATSEILRR